MRYKLVADVIGKSLLLESLVFEMSPFSVEFNSNSANLLETVSVSVKVEDIERFLPSIEQVNQQLQISIVAPPYRSQMVKLLQTLESLGSYLFRFEKILWEYPKEQWIPENDSERERLKLLQFERLDKKPEYHLRKVTKELAHQLLVEHAKYDDLVIPLAFYREGSIEFDNKRYVKAYFEFYFVLEDLFGEGKTRNRDVMDKFVESETLRKAVEATLDLFSMKAKSDGALSRLFAERNCRYDFEGAIKFIVLTRGTLHHFSQRSSLKTATPFNVNMFHTEAFLLMHICELCFAQIVAERSPSFGNLIGGAINY